MRTCRARFINKVGLQSCGGSQSVYKETVVLRRRVNKHLVSYQHEVDKGKLAAEANFEKMTFRKPVSPSLEQSEGVWVLYLYIGYEALLLVGYKHKSNP